MWVALVFILPLFWKGITCQDYSIEVNSSVSVQEGLCVTIPCTFIADGRRTFHNSFGYWKPLKSYNYVATNDKSSVVTKTNFNLMGNPDNGDCTLTLTDARKKDDGEYFFRFEESKSSRVKFNYNEKVVTISVTDLTEEPVISDLGTVTAGINKTLTCTPPGNCPVTSLGFQWKKSNVAGIWKNSSTVTFTPSLYDLQKNITCLMTNSKKITTQKTVLLDVCCPPAITITFEICGQKRNKSASIKVDEGSSVILRCSLQSNLTLNVTWTNGKNNILRHGIGTELELRLDNMTMNQTGTYTCSALTDYVINITSINVTVQYPPRNMEIIIKSSKGSEVSGNQQVIIDQMETLTLICRVDGNPTASMVWVKGEVDTEKSKMSNRGLSAMITVTSSMLGVYRCLAWNALGLKEQRIQVGIKQDTKSTTTSETCDKNKMLYIAIAFICGMSITIVILVLYKVITRKKVTKKTYVRSEEPSASPEPPTDEIYMNISNPEQKCEEATDNNVHLDSSGVTLDQEDLHYSTLAFTAVPSKVPSSQPETEYAEVKLK